MGEFDDLPEPDAVRRRVAELDAESARVGSVLQAAFTRLETEFETVFVQMATKLQDHGLTPPVEFVSRETLKERYGLFGMRQRESISDVVRHGWLLGYWVEDDESSSRHVTYLLPDGSVWPSTLCGAQALLPDDLQVRAARLSDPAFLAKARAALVEELKRRYLSWCGLPPNTPMEPTRRDR